MDIIPAATAALHLIVLLNTVSPESLIPSKSVSKKTSIITPPCEHSDTNASLVLILNPI